MDSRKTTVQGPAVLRGGSVETPDGTKATGAEIILDGGAHPATLSVGHGAMVVAQGARATIPAAPNRPEANPAKPSRTGWLSAADLAIRFGIPLGSLRKRLERWRHNHADGWMEVSSTERAPRDPKFLYRLDAVGDVVSAGRRK